MPVVLKNCLQGFNLLSLSKVYVCQLNYWWSCLEISLYDFEVFKNLNAPKHWTRWILIESKNIKLSWSLYSLLTSLHDAVFSCIIQHIYFSFLYCGEQQSYEWFKKIILVSDPIFQFANFDYQLRFCKISLLGCIFLNAFSMLHCTEQGAILCFSYDTTSMLYPVWMDFYLVTLCKLNWPYSFCKSTFSLYILVLLNCNFLA